MRMRYGPRTQREVWELDMILPEAVEPASTCRPAVIDVAGTCDRHLWAQVAGTYSGLPQQTLMGLGDRLRGIHSESTVVVRVEMGMGRQWRLPPWAPWFV